MQPYRVGHSCHTVPLKPNIKVLLQTGLNNWRCATLPRLVHSLTTRGHFCPVHLHNKSANREVNYSVVQLLPKEVNSRMDLWPIFVTTASDQNLKVDLLFPVVARRHTLLCPTIFPCIKWFSSHDSDSKRESFFSLDEFEEYECRSSS